VRPSIEQPELYIDTNIKGTFHLLENARRTGCGHFVFASSSSVYGVNKKVPFSEEDPILQTISPYAMTKMAGEQMCSNYSHLHGLRTVCLRFFTVYGPRQRPDLAISKFTRLIEDGLPIDKYGDGHTARDYTYIDDIVEGVVGALHHRQGPLCDIFNLGGSQTVTLNELIALVEAAVGRPARINALPEQPGDVPLTSADVGKAARLLDIFGRALLADERARRFDVALRGGRRLRIGHPFDCRRPTRICRCAGLRQRSRCGAHRRRQCGGKRGPCPLFYRRPVRDADAG
jgi:UDP-glucuronate 4-epimerase